MLKVMRQNSGTLVRTPEETVLIFRDRRITLDPNQDTGEQLLAEWIAVCKEADMLKAQLATSERVVAEFRGLV